MRVIERFLRRQAARLTVRDLDGLLGRLGPLFKIILGRPSLRGLRDDARLLAAMIRDYRRGAYARVPFWAVAAAGFALLYVLNPIDLVPDFVPFLGYLDDAFLLTQTLSFIRRELDEYRQWKQAQEGADANVIDVEPAEEP